MKGEGQNINYFVCCVCERVVMTYNWRDQLFNSDNVKYGWHVIIVDDSEVEKVRPGCGHVVRRLAEVDLELVRG